MNHRKTVTRRVFIAGSSATAGAVLVGGSVAHSAASQRGTEFPSPELTSDSAPASAEIVLDNPAQAKLATESSVLADAIDANHTTFDVTTTAGSPWTTDTREFTTLTDG